MIPSYPYIFFAPLRLPPALFHLSPRPTLKGTNINPRLGCPPPCRRCIQPGCICQRGTRADLSSIKCRHHSSQYNKPSNVCDAHHAAFEVVRTICTKSLIRALYRDAGIKSRQVQVPTAETHKYADSLEQEQLKYRRNLLFSSLNITLYKRNSIMVAINMCKTTTPIFKHYSGYI